MPNLHIKSMRTAKPHIRYSEFLRAWCCANIEARACVNVIRVECIKGPSHAYAIWLQLKAEAEMRQLLENSK